jgi:hypothetical protein
MKIIILFTVFTFFASCAPRDEKVTNPFYTSRAEREALEMTSFNEHFKVEKNLGLELGMIVGSQLGEAAKVLELIINKGQFLDKFLDRCVSYKETAVELNKSIVQLSFFGCRGEESKKLKYTLTGSMQLEVFYRENEAGKRFVKEIIARSGAEVNGEMTFKNARYNYGNIEKSIAELSFSLVGESEEKFKMRYQVSRNFFTHKSPKKNKGYEEKGVINSLTTGIFSLAKVKDTIYQVATFSTEREDKLLVDVRAKREGLYDGSSHDYLVRSDFRLRPATQGAAYEVRMGLPGEERTFLRTQVDSDGNTTSVEKTEKFCSTINGTLSAKIDWVFGLPRNPVFSKTKFTMLNFTNGSLLATVRLGPNSEAVSKSKMTKCPRAPRAMPLFGPSFFYFK